MRSRPADCQAISGATAPYRTERHVRQQWGGLWPATRAPSPRFDRGQDARSDRLEASPTLLRLDSHHRRMRVVVPETIQFRLIRRAVVDHEAVARNIFVAGFDLHIASLLRREVEEGFGGMNSHRLWRAKIVRVT